MNRDLQFDRMTKPGLRDFLKESNGWPVARLQELQWQKLQALLTHAYGTCEFYHNRFVAAGLHPQRDFHSFECLQKLPVLTKEDIQRNLEGMKTTDPSVAGIELNSTGGSTGEPLNFYQDDNYRQWADAAARRAWRHFDGVSPRAIEAVLWGADRDVGRKFSYKALLKRVLRSRSLPLNTFDLDADKIRRYFRIYNLLRPQILRGYASSLHYVAEHLAKCGMKVHQPKVIISSAEVLRPQMREKISEYFGAPIIDSYGCREVSQIATECLHHCGLHLVMENQYVEVIDGQILVTNLNNRAMPFIRYQVGDLAERIETAPCTCGREAHRLIGLNGRDNDNITFPNGTTINGEFFEFLFFGLHTVEQFQVIYSRQEEQLLVRLRVSDPSEDVGQMVASKLREGFAFENVRIEYTDHFDKTRTGKLRFVYAVDHFDEVGCHA